MAPTGDHRRVGPRRAGRAWFDGRLVPDETAGSDGLPAHPPARGRRPDGRPLQHPLTVATQLLHSRLETGSRHRNKKPAKPCASRVSWLWPRADSNRRHGDFQSPALPTELPGRIAPPGRFPPAHPAALRRVASHPDARPPSAGEPTREPSLLYSISLPHRKPVLAAPRGAPTALAAPAPRAGGDGRRSKPRPVWAPSGHDQALPRALFWWANQESNLGPLACKASALPLSYSPA